MSSLHHKFVSLLLSTFLLVSCGKNADEQRISSMLSARILLTERKCQDAIDVLEGAGRDVNNADYMILLASAYGCRGGFDALRLFESDIPLFSLPAPMGGIARFTSSDDMTTATDSDYSDVLTAINLLLYAGDLSSDEHPTSALRREVFSKADADDIDMALLYLLLTNLGRYFNYFANASHATGVKGDGPGLHSCFLNYSAVNFDFGVPNYPGLEFTDMADYLANNGGLAGACVNLDAGSDDLGLQGAINVARACQGIVMLNNFLHIFPNVIGSIAGTDFTDIAAMEAVLNSAKLLVENHKAGANTLVNDALSQSLCVSENTADTDFIEAYFAFVMEPLIQ